jgi:hypothetical protein
VANQSFLQFGKRHIRLILERSSQLLTRFLVDPNRRAHTMKPLRRHIAGTTVEAPYVFDRGLTDLEQLGHFTLRLDGTLAGVNNSPTQIHRIGSWHHDTSSKDR